MANIQESEDLKSAMAKLTRAMHHLIDILSTTNDEMVTEFKRTTMSQHFEKISDQNEKIANALINMVELQEQRHPQQITEQPQQALGQDNIPGMQTPADPIDQLSQEMQPMNQQFQTPQENVLPGLNIPPPEHHDKRKGLGSLFKK